MLNLLMVTSTVQGKSCARHLRQNVKINNTHTQHNTQLDRNIRFERKNQNRKVQYSAKENKKSKSKKIKK